MHEKHFLVDERNQRGKERASLVIFQERKKLLVKEAQEAFDTFEQKDKNKQKKQQRF